MVADSISLPSRWLFVFNSNIVRMNQDSRSGLNKLYRFDHPPGFH
jgi:hypothetical protein